MIKEDSKCERGCVLAEDCDGSCEVADVEKCQKNCELGQDCSCVDGDLPPSFDRSAAEKSLDDKQLQLEQEIGDDAVAVHDTEGFARAIGDLSNLVKALALKELQAKQEELVKEEPKEEPKEESKVRLEFERSAPSQTAAKMDASFSARGRLAQKYLPRRCRW